MQDDLKTVLIKRSELLLTNVTYSINMKLKKKTMQNTVYKRYYTTETVYVDGCTIGIKRIAQCLENYGKHSLIIFLITVE